VASAQGNAAGALARSRQREPRERVVVNAALTKPVDSTRSSPG